MTLRKKPLILVADDEEDIRASLRMILEYEGMDLVEAASGPEALDKAAAEEPDAALLDIKMPRMDGLEVLATLRERDAELPVVMISGHGTIATAVEATRLGAFDFMEKPLERDRVLRRRPDVVQLGQECEFSLPQVHLSASHKLGIGRAVQVQGAFLFGRTLVQPGRGILP